MKYQKGKPKLVEKLREGDRIFIEKNGKTFPIKVLHIMSSPQFSSYVHISYRPLSKIERDEWKKKPWLVFSFDSKFAAVFSAIPKQNFSFREKISPKKTPAEMLCDEWDALNAKDLKEILSSGRARRR